uniref:SAM domain-containing protein n=1 Tax=Ciona intestinalis TaxID=7719 RepID=H2XL57_CIOIN
FFKIMGDLDESGIFDASLSMWKGLNYEDEEFDPIPLDIFTAASLGESEIVQEILDRKAARLNSVNRLGWSALMYASYMGHENTVHCLLDNSADPNQRTPQGYSSIILASMCGNEHCIHVLIQQGGDINAVDKRGWSALLHSASAGHQQTTEFLIKCGANCEIMEPKHGLTPLMEAAASGHEIIVQQLLQKGVDVSRVNHQGENAWTLALAYDHRKIASMIEQHKLTRQKSVYLTCVNHEDTGYVNHKNGKSSKDNNCGQSGPRIHAGPKAFAQMTGLGADGKPHPHSTVPHFLFNIFFCSSIHTIVLVCLCSCLLHVSVLQDNPPHLNEDTRQPPWEGPKVIYIFLLMITSHRMAVLLMQLSVFFHKFSVKITFFFKIENKIAFFSKLKNLKSSNFHFSPRNIKNESFTFYLQDLESLLHDIGCSKHLPIFQKQDIDLRIFLSLTEEDLKEIGITLFGPRRRMVSCIARLTSGIQVHLDRIESAYADALNAKQQRLQVKLKENQEEKEELKSQVAQERELRKVTESVLME